MVERNTLMSRFIAVSILFIPICIAIIGIKMIRDTLFSILHWPFPNYLLQFVAAVIMVFVGVSFIAGFIYRRDLRRNKVKKKISLKRD